MTITRWALVLGLWPLLACSSESDPESRVTTFEKNPCVTAGASYLTHYTEQPGGTCGPLSDEVLAIPPDGMISVPDCRGKPRYEGCSVFIDQIECESNGYTSTQTGKVDWADDGSTGHGFITFTVAGQCKSTYEMNSVRL